jgi:hypothetical protein
VTNPCFFSSFARIIAKRTVHLKAFRMSVYMQSIIAGTKHVIAASVQRVDGASAQLAAANAPTMYGILHQYGHFVHSVLISSYVCYLYKPACGCIADAVASKRDLIAMQEVVLQQMGSMQQEQQQQLAAFSEQIVEIKRMRMSITTYADVGKACLDHSTVVSLAEVLPIQAHYDISQSPGLLSKVREANSQWTGKRSEEQLQVCMCLRFLLPWAQLTASG